MIWNPKIECEGRGEIKDLQLKRLKETVERIYSNVPYYKKKLDEAGVTPDSIKSLDDLKRIPFTTKDDLRENYPFGLFASPMKDIVRIHASSGTTGKPTVVGYTKNDLDTWSEAIARLACAAGATEDDIAQISFGYGLFTGGFGLHYGLEKVGLAIIPASTGNTEKQIMLMKDFGTTLLVSTPSYALYMSEVAEKMGIDIKKDLKLKIGMFGSEGSTEEMRQEIEKRWGMTATENYGLSEIMGPGVAGECTEKCGMHVSDDLFIVEIINPETGEVLPEGEVGELVITNIKKEGIPLLRYRTKDITYLDNTPCKCGRTTPRIAKIQGRSDDMLKIKGVNVFPSQIESALLGTKGIAPYYQIIVKKVGFVDDMEVLVELNDDSLLEKFSELEKLERTVKHKIKTVLGLDIKIKLVEPQTIERTAGKAKRVIDLRK
ncbi:phenylacetate--CoA ligase family protein [Qingrenia yutianensis]|uniref:Phenylacetate-coenzyme A ligase n=1 Tax=Qingrenia yutianensis TaxID=2763676 RepID=A0A926FBV6_9FIRM|nr:phenylacetate--CoA ligase [Qingrenia yutianensis]MBC8595465.1 phenylacetate--CoA ligase [Qingrenia yutianensis]